MTAENGNYFVNLLKVLLKNSWNCRTWIYFWKIFCHLNPLWGTTASRRDRRSWSLSAFYYPTAFFPLANRGLSLRRRPPQGPLRRRRQRCRRRRHSSQRLQVAKTRHKISSLDVISLVFPGRFQQIYIYFRFRRISFILKICQTVAGLSMVRQFHDFFI